MMLATYCRSPALWLGSVPLLQQTVIRRVVPGREQHTVRVCSILTVEVAQESSTPLSFVM